MVVALGNNTFINNILEFFLLSLAYIALLKAVADIYLGNPVTFWSVFAAIGKHYWAVIGAGILIGLGLVLPAIVGIFILMLLLRNIGILLGLFFSLPYIFYFATRWGLANPAIISENLGGSAGLKRSWQLSQGFFWRVFGTSSVVTLLSLLLVWLPQLLAGYLLGSLSASAVQIQVSYVVLGNFLSIFSFPFASAVTTLIYYDLRIRKEAFDLQFRTERGQPPVAPVTPTAAKTG